MVLTDWYNDSDPVKELRAGINVKMPIGDESKLLAALSSGDLTRAELISAVKPTVKAILDSRKTAEISSRSSVPTVKPVSLRKTATARTERSTATDFLNALGHYDTA